MQNLNPLFKFSIKHEYGATPSDDRELGDGMSNLERLAVWKKYFLRGGLGDLMKMWIVLGRLSYRV
jgi:hypothetical protein